MTLGPILGNPACPHPVEYTRWYRGYEGIYSVCHQCGGHFWDENQVVPDGVEVVDLMAMLDEDEEDCD